MKMPQERGTGGLTMARLIDADALWRKFENEPWYDNADRDEIALSLVDDAPTVDAVEVVRCRDCKHSECYDALLYCGHTRGLAGSVAPNNFCSYGERKDGDGNG